MKIDYLLNEINNQISLIKPAIPFQVKDMDVTGLAINSKKAKKGSLFFCLSGTQHKGSEFINEACKNGCRAVMAEEDIKSKLPQDIIIIKVKDIIKCLGLIVNIFYGFPIDKLNTTAVTGTNGKTTITFILESIFNTYGRRTGVIGTVNYRFSKTVFNAINTTPDILIIYNMIKNMLADKIKYLFMEVSSHALSQRRIEGLKFDQAIFTNLTQDHFDYHKTKNNYFKAKSILFTNYLKDDGIAIINIDDSYGTKLIDLIGKYKKNSILTYGLSKEADIFADNIKLKYDGSYFTINTEKHKLKVETNLIGLFNVYNILASVGACLAMKIPEKYIIKGLEKIYVPGRLERIDNNHNLDIFVDYAHTEDALKNVLSTLRNLSSRGRLIVVFGCGGNRDKNKRHKMGRVASELADFVIITSDNPRFEDPNGIISDIKSGIRKTNYTILIDRKEAIKKALEIAKSKDIILVAGKGHEDYQIIDDKKIPFSDRSIIEGMLSQKGFSLCLN